MNLDDEYRLQEYQDLGELDGNSKIRLKRNCIWGNICVEKRVSGSLKYIYEFLKEKQIDHIPKIYECISDGEMLIVMEEYIEGRTLETIVKERVIQQEEIARIALELCDALGVLHHSEPAIICRDLKAENIMIDNHGKSWLVDFDIARTYESGKNRDTVLLGTAEYAAPEQFGFSQTDNRTDIYALGVLMNYMATQKFPYDEKASGRLSSIVSKCLALEPEKRYQDVEELKRDILFTFFQENVEKKKQTGSKSYCIPGFRSNILWKKIVAVCGYTVITYFAFSMEIISETVELTNWMLKIEQTIIWISQIFFVMISWNYRGWREQLPVLKNENKVIKSIGILLLEFILLFIAALICACCEMIIFKSVC